MSCAPDGSEIVVAGGVDRRWRFCRCRVCGLVERCTPIFDFFQLKADPIEAGLLCEPCFTNAVVPPVVPPVLQ